MKKSKLDPKRARFVQEYLVDLNATQAAIRAGYSKKTAQEQSSRLLSNVIIQRSIAKAQASRAARVEETLDEWTRELKGIFHLDPGDLLEPDGSIKLIKDMPIRARKAISSIEVVELFDGGQGDQKQAIGLVKKIRFHPKVNAGELLGKNCGFFEKDNSQKPPAESRLTVEIVHTK